VDPLGAAGRRTGVQRLTLALAALVLPMGLAACGDDTQVAADPAPTSTSPSASPSASPGTYPAYPQPDYTYDLSVQCFCMGSGSPIEVTVEGGAVVAAVYLADDTGRGGTSAGDPADQRFWLTINDVIDLANHSDAERIEVDWPAGQDYPDRVFIDGSKRIADDEIGYSISNVRT
jgi:hypothetical protein